MSRLPLLDEARLTPEQQAVFDEIRGGPRGLVEGPLRVWLQSAGFAERAQKLGAFCRYGTSLPPLLSELAIIVVGAHWRAGFEWSVHAPIAAKAGLAPQAIESIRVGAQPALTSPEEIAVYDFSKELLDTKRVSERAYAAIVSKIGTKGAVELVGILGYYTLICMTINAFQIPVPENGREPFEGELFH